MKIVLNNQEVKSFERFLGQYVRVCKETLVSMATEDTKEMLAEIEGKSINELVNIMVKDMDISPLVKVCSNNEDEMVLDVNSDILLAYNEYMASSMKVLSPYACKLAMICVKHEEVLKKVSTTDSSFWKKSYGVLGRLLVKYVKGILAPLGLTELFNEVVELYKEFKTDEYGQGAMKDLLTCLEQRTTDICTKK